MSWTEEVAEHLDYLPGRKESRRVARRGKPLARIHRKGIKENAFSTRRKENVREQIVLSFITKKQQAPDEDLTQEEEEGAKAKAKEKKRARVRADREKDRIVLEKEEPLLQD